MPWVEHDRSERAWCRVDRRPCRRIGHAALSQRCRTHRGNGGLGGRGRGGGDRRGRKQVDRQVRRIRVGRLEIRHAWPQVDHERLAFDAYVRDELTRDTRERGEVQGHRFKADRDA